MPYELYKKVENEIPYEIGCYVAIDHLEDKEELITNQYGITNKKIWVEPVNGMNELYCIKPAKRVDLKADKEVILSSMLRSMRRDFNRNRRFEYENLSDKEVK